MQAERRRFVRKPNSAAFREHLADVRGRGAGPGAGDGVVEAIRARACRKSCCLKRRAADVEGAVLGPVAHERLQDVEALIAGPDPAVSEVVRVVRSPEVAFTASTSSDQQVRKWFTSATISFSRTPGRNLC
jgi:hypothetical protein